MKYTRMSKLEMLGELVLIGNEKVLEIGKALYHTGTAEDLRNLLMSASVHEDGDETPKTS